MINGYTSDVLKSSQNCTSGHKSPNKIARFSAFTINFPVTGVETHCELEKRVDNSSHRVQN